MVIGTYFLVQLFCGYFGCNSLYDEPSDPLNLSSRAGREYKNFEENPVVWTPRGSVEGYVIKSILQRPIYTFEGIPYGETTAGKNRFRKPIQSPIPKRAWQGVRSAKKAGSPCIQLNTFKFGAVLGREDCLFLNIYSTELPSRNETSESILPVVVWFHGGGFHFGAGDVYGPAYLLDHDMILVTLNYRLGIHGFLSTLDKESPGNYGLKDQALALKWVHENIQYFGGNSSLITLMGQSAGGTSVHLQMISQQARPYFSAVIAFSGTALSSWSVLRETHVRVINSKLANLTSCPSDSSSRFMKCLRSIEPSDLARREAFLSDWLQWPAILLGPVVEPASPEAFLMEYPKDAYARGNVAKYPLIVSMTAQEGHQAVIFLDGLQRFKSFSTKWEERAPLFLDYNYIVPPSQYNGITHKVSKFYFGDQDPRDVNSKVYGQMTTDALFHLAMHKTMEAHSQIAPTYGTIFGYKGMYGFGLLFGYNQSDYGVAHTDDIWFYVNSSTYVPGFKTTDEDYEIVKFSTGWIYNFAKSREPILIDGNAAEYRGWKPVKDPNPIEVLSVGKDVKMIPEPRTKYLQFWDSLGIFS